MNDTLRFAEAVCSGHPDRLADTIAERVVALALSRDPDALVGIEVALHRGVVFVDGRVAAGRDGRAALDEAELAALVRRVFAEAGYGDSPSGCYRPDPAALEVRFDLCLGSLDEAERSARDTSDDQAICVGHAAWGPRAGHRPLEQALANEFVVALERLRVERPALGLGPDGKALVVVRGRRLVGVSLSLHHAPGSEWVTLTRQARAACEAVAAEFVAAGELAPPGGEEWLVNGAGAFEVGGPLGDNGLSGKKLVAQAYGAAVPIGGGATCGKDPRKVDPRGQALARRIALDRVVRGTAREATVWLAYRPGDVTPRWLEVVEVPDDDRTRDAKRPGSADPDVGCQGARRTLPSSAPEGPARATTGRRRRPSAWPCSWRAAAVAAAAPRRRPRRRHRSRRRACRPRAPASWSCTRASTRPGPGRWRRRSGCARRAAAGRSGTTRASRWCGAAARSSGPRSAPTSSPRLPTGATSRRATSSTGSTSRSASVDRRASRRQGE
jgi:S-adenosylmethionine synthetase